MAVNLLIRELETLGSGYLPGDQDGREAVYYAIRDAFNRKKPEIDYTTCCRDGVARAAQLIFLNRTCYSGHFQVNCQGGFNVPIGRYANPEILFEDNLRNVATVLERTRIINADFTQCSDFDNDTTFVYPSYSPLNGTASLTSYSMEGFFDGDPVRLARFIRTLDATGAKLMLSNSDPRNDDPADSFFEDLCAGYRIERVPARRIINCNGARCGEIRELVITHYRPARLSCGYCFPRPIVSTTPFPAVPAIRFTGEHAFASGIPN